MKKDVPRLFPRTISWHKEVVLVSIEQNPALHATPSRVPNCAINAKCTVIQPTTLNVKIQGRFFWTSGAFSHSFGANFIVANATAQSRKNQLGKMYLQIGISMG